jgi:hypothetical protein
MLTPTRFAFLFCFGAALSGGARPGAAEVLILSSSVDGLKAGVELADSERLVGHVSQIADTNASA